MMQNRELMDILSKLPKSNEVVVESDTQSVARKVTRAWLFVDKFGRAFTHDDRSYLAKDIGCDESQIVRCIVIQDSDALIAELATTVPQTKE